MVRSQSIVLKLFFLLFISGFISVRAQVKFPPEFEKNMKKYKVRFELTVLSLNKKDTLLAGYTPFFSKKNLFTSKFAMFKNPKAKKNLAYYIDTCRNQYNLQAEIMGDISSVFGIKDAGSFELRDQNEWSVLLNAEEVVFTAMANSKKLLKPFADYDKTVIVCYYNNNTKGKIYVVMNFDGELDYYENDFMRTLMELSFYPHAPSREMQPELIVQTGSNDFIYSISTSSSGKLLAYGGEEGVIKITNGDGSREYRTIRAHPKSILNLEFSHNERLLISCSRDSVIKVWEVETGNLVAELTGHKEEVNDIAFFDKDRKLLSTSSDSTIKVWDIAAKKCVKTLDGFRNKTAQIDMGYSDQHAVINMLKGKVKILDIKDFSSRDIETGFDQITDLTMPYSNAIVVSSGKAVKYIYTESKKERIISTEKDSAYCWFVPIMKKDGTGNMNLLMLTRHGYGRLYDYDSHSFIQKFRYNDFDAQYYFCLGYNPQYNLAVYGGSTYCTTYNMNTAEYTFIMGAGAIPYDVQADGQNEVFRIGFDGFTSLVSLRSGRITWNSSAAKIPIRHLSVLNKTSGNIAYLSPEDKIVSYDYRQNSVVYKFSPVSSPKYFTALATDSSFIYMTKEGNVLLHKKGMSRDRILDTAYSLKIPEIIRDTFLLFQDKENACLKNIYTDKVITLGKYTLHNWSDPLDENLKYFAIRTKDTVIHLFDKYSFIKVNELADKKITRGLKNFTLNPVKEEIIIGNLDAELSAIDLNTKQVIKKWKPHVGYMDKPKYTADGKLLITIASDAFVKLWRAADYSALTSTYSAQYGSYITVTPEKYYVASASFAKEFNPNLAYYSYGNTHFDLADLDLEFNRPDIISKALGYESEEIIQAYKKLYGKRLKRLHLENTAKLSNNNRPVLRSISTYPPEVHSSNLRLFFVLHDDNRKLKSIKISINDVPLYGAEGTEVIDEIRLSDYSSIPLATSIQLNKGWNKVSVKITNEDNIESYPYTFSTWYSNAENKAKPKLHIIGIGVSEFKERQYNLKYPAKDVRDIIKLFQNQKNQYSEIIVDTLLNDSATLKNILKLKEKIRRDHKEDSVGVNDKVMIFAATHGLLDKNLDYYLATYDVNFENPSQNGLLYSEIESLLDHIPPRNKVVLIDACHSGEIDKDEVVITKNEPVAENGSIAFRSASSSKISPGEGILKNSMNLMKEMFIDLRKTSGATVISSAGGTEYAIEGEEWNNGVFSYSIINALRKHKADINNDNKVYLSELQKYIEVDVPAITHGKQQPTSRSENISNDILIWRNDFNEELAGAIKVNDKELVEKLIKEGADVASTDSNGATTLMWAVMYSDLDMVKRLVAKKVDIHAKGAIYIDPLKNAYYYGNLTGIAVAKKKMDILRYLVEEKKVNVNEREYNPATHANSGWPPIAYAVSGGNKEMISYLLSKGADINMPADSATGEGLEHMAFSRGDPAICQLLVSKGLKYKRKDKNGNTIITRSVTGANNEVFKLAVKLYKEAVNTFSNDSVYPVLYAAFNGKTANLKELRLAGADMKVLTPGGQTIVHLAARQADVEVLKMALQLYPGGLNVQDKQGLTPLLSAIYAKQAAAAQYLCEKGADLSLKDSEGATFEDYVKYYNDEAMLKLLEKYKK